MSVQTDKSPSAYRTISEVADGLDLPQHVLRFWETRFPQIRPMKRGGGRRYYRPEDVELLKAIRRLLYDQGYTIKGVQRMLREQGASAVIHAQGRAPAAEPARAEPHFDVAVDTPHSATPEDFTGSGEPGLGADAMAALRGALADIREAERQLRQARAE